MTASHVSAILSADDPTRSGWEDPARPRWPWRIVPAVCALFDGGAAAQPCAPHWLPAVSQDGVPRLICKPTAPASATGDRNGLVNVRAALEVFEDCLR